MLVCGGGGGFAQLGDWPQLLTGVRVIDFLLIRNACLPPALLSHVLGHIPVLFNELIDDGMVTSSLKIHWAGKGLRQWWGKEGLQNLSNSDERKCCSNVYALMLILNHKPWVHSFLPNLIILYSIFVFTHICICISICPIQSLSIQAPLTPHPEAEVSNENVRDN